MNSSDSLLAYSLLSQEHIEHLSEFCPSAFSDAVELSQKNPEVQGKLMFLMGNPQSEGEMGLDISSSL